MSPTPRTRRPVLTPALTSRQPGARTRTRRGPRRTWPLVILTALTLTIVLIVGALMAIAAPATLVHRPSTPPATTQDSAPTAPTPHPPDSGPPAAEAPAPEVPESTGTPTTPGPTTTEPTTPEPTAAPTASTPPAGEPVEGIDYSYTATIDGRPAQWPCHTTIPVILIGPAPEGAQEALTDTVTVLREITGLPLQPQTTTSADTRAGSLGAIIVTYQAEDARTWGTTLGNGGITYIPNTGQVTRGQATIRADHPDTDPTTPQGHAVLLHELAHALGLNHATQDSGQLMAPTANPNTTLGTGDTHALTTLGCQ